MKRFSLFHQLLIGGIVLCTLLAAGAFYLLRPSIAAPSTPTPEPDKNQASISEVEQAIQMAIDLEAQALPVFLLYENQVEDVRVSEDGNWSTAWLTPTDPDTGEVIPTEPGLVIAQRVGDRWQVYLPADAGWLEALRQTPDELISMERKLVWVQEADVQPQAAPAAPIGGYRLPFPGGDTRRLTQSVGHDRYTASGNAHYSFDFATAYPSGLFQVVAARGGIVRRVRWTQANGDPSEPGNYVVLEDTSTNPTTYQLYLHFAQDSIPPELRVIGTPVRRGQYLGMADDTGVSSGHHLHFMVHTTATSYWGRSVDITFEDVAINGGRPRIQSDLSHCNSSDVCSSTQIDYLSQNYLNPDPNPPIGGITAPALGGLIPGATVRLEGWAQDDSSGLYSAQFLANHDGTWRPIGSSFSTSSFSLNWDMCAAGVPDGPVSFALQIRDKAFNQAPGLPGLTHISKNFTCAPTPPACTPSASQIALFSEKDFQGACVVLGTGNFTNGAALGDVGSDRTVSVKVGANVKTTLFTDSGYAGRSETLVADDSNLNDNRVPKNTVSSVKVQLRTATPAVPVVVWPAAGATFNADASVSLSWSDAGGASQFQARLMRDSVQVQSIPWQSHVFWHLGSLTPGSYTWQVKSRIGATESSWSAARAFTIQTTGTTPATPTVSAPFDDPMEVAGGWTGLGGWAQTPINHTQGGQKSWLYAPRVSSYDTGSVANSGYLTSPPISLPAGGAQYLRFWYQHSTESNDPHWDQRWVQISANGGPYINLMQLYDDPLNYWARSPAISLQAYAGQTVRVRFYFATLDAHLNNFTGWLIDDVSVTAAPPPACSNDNNDAPGTASDLAYGGSFNGAICPSGDVDYYRFSGAAGDVIGAWTEAQSKGSSLDTYLTLLDNDGRSVLVKNDDMVLYQRSDSLVNYQLPRSGTYYLKVQSWDHPTSGDASLTYTLRLARDTQDPVAAFVSPAPNGRIAQFPLKLQVFASDGQSGVSRVRFLWHSSDWQTGAWTLLGEDWDGSDGWSHDFSGAPASLYGGAVYAQVYDWAGNWLGVGAWQVSPPGIYLPLILK